ncbi:MAG: amino acid racemase [Alphaproteobacteria bacterium]|nr:amino acid racemase [Alphaproteobacteria bacterium]
MRTVGIIGGLGPETTAEFYLSIVAQCQRFAREHRPNMLINNIPMPYQTEEDALLRGMNVDQYIPYLTQSAQILEKAGADFLVMPCNTLHRYAQEIRQSVSIPFISVVDVVTDFARKYNLNNVGLIATNITLESGFYQNAFQNQGISCHIPSGLQQAKLAKMIFGLVTGQYSHRHRQELIDIIQEFDTQEIPTVLLACTDLQALIPHHPRIKIFDTMQLLADQTVLEICK